MKPIPCLPTAVPSLLAIAVLVAGCASPPDRYYTLATPAEAGAAKREATRPAYIEIAPLALPERLARPQLVVRKTAQSAEVELLEQHRWSSSFESELRDALAGGVAARLGAIDLTHGGRQPELPVWRVAVQVRQFDAIEDTRVDAGFSWSVRRSNADRTAACQWTASEPVAAGIGALAQGAQRVTAGLADAIARHLAALQSNPEAGCPD